MSVDTSNATATAGVDPSRLRIAGAIKQAASTTGTSFEYLLATAKMESDFNPKAGASTSSAHGLYQFIEQTWLGTVKEAGTQLGYGKYADAITRSPSGSYSVSDPAVRTAIMKLRDDPAAASSMAAVLTQSNSFKLTGKIGRRPTDGELYMAHFMGVGGAAKLISNAEDNPNATAARLFPNAAAANRSIFYDRSGRARSVSEVHSVLSARYAGAANSQATRSAMAAVGDIKPNVALANASPSAAPVDNAVYLSTFPDVRAVTPVTMASASAPTNTSPPSDPIFRSLFQAGGERAQPVSPTVRELWGNSSSLTSVAAATPVSPLSQTPDVRSPQPLDLFSDRNGTFSS
jgi:Transglycosylase SLT domain